MVLFLHWLLSKRLSEDGFTADAFVYRQQDELYFTLPNYYIFFNLMVPILKRLYNKSWGNQIEPARKNKKSRAYLERIR